MVEVEGSPLWGVASGLLFGGIGVGLLVKTRRFLSRAVRVPGMVTGLRGSASGNGRSYFPRLTFRTHEGQEVHTESRFSQNPPPAQPGQSVTILYDPRDPNRARVDSVKGRGLYLAWCFTVSGAVLTVSFIGFMIRGLF